MFVLLSIATVRGRRLAKRAVWSVLDGVIWSLMGSGLSFEVCVNCLSILVRWSECCLFIAYLGIVW